MQTQNIAHDDVFFREYTSNDAILKYTRKTAGFGISHLLEHDYKAVYVDALERLPAEMRHGPLNLLEFGCGAGMNLVNLISFFSKQGLNVARAVGTDFSPVLIDAAKREAQNYLSKEEFATVQFAVAKNETLIEDLSAASQLQPSELKNSFHFILGVNTIRYCHRAHKQLDCSREIFDLLAPGGVCVVIDMNDRFPAFRSALRNKLSGPKDNEEECYLPSLEEYTEPFAQSGFQVLRSEHFCWVPHSAGALLTGVLHRLSPVLDMVAGSRAMRSLVVAKKPETQSA